MIEAVGSRAFPDDGRDRRRESPFEDLVAAFAEDNGIDPGEANPGGEEVFDIDDIRVTLAPMPGGRAMLVSATVGEPPDEGAERLYRALLETSAAAVAADGVSFALDPLTDEVVMQRVVTLDGLDFAGFRANLAVFVDLLAKGRALLAEYESAAEDTGVTGVGEHGGL